MHDPAINRPEARRLLLSDALDASNCNRCLVRIGTLLLEHFDPQRYLIKIPPLNPTYRAEQNNLVTYVDPSLPDKGYPIIDRVRRAGYEVILNIGELSENQIGSNCGQYVARYLDSSSRLTDGYAFDMEPITTLDSVTAS